MENERKQKGGKKLELNTAIDIPNDIYLEYCTPDEQETIPKRKIKDAHASSLKTIDDYPEEKTKHLSKLQKQAEAAVRKFNEESTGAATAATSSAAETSQRVETKSSPTPIKTKVTTRRGTRPSLGKIIKVPSASEGSDEYDDETLQAIIRNKQERVAQASRSAIPLAMDPKVLSDYIHVWYDDPKTPIDDLKLPPCISHMVATFINEAKWKEAQAKQAKAAKLKKEKFLRQNLLDLAFDALVSLTHEIEYFDRQAAPAATPQQPEIEEEQPARAEEMPQESRADEPAIEEITKETPDDDFAPANETAPADASKPADDSAADVLRYSFLLKKLLKDQLHQLKNLAPPPIKLLKLRKTKEKILSLKKNQILSKTLSVRLRMKRFLLRSKSLNQRLGLMKFLTQSKILSQRHMKMKFLILRNMLKIMPLHHV
ncbi:hypothetical protein ZWY2020_046697 [Hordeum vulgare]|nr:hypothetical protein ZWY2020_046697 [Hordeum vulgare]